MSILYKILILVGISSYSLANVPKVPTSSGYASGRTLCTGEYAPLLTGEKGFFVSVPVDYYDPSKGETEVYAFVSGGRLNPEWPTVFYFTGGPGLPSHWGMAIEGAKFNVIHMDQRGIGCSRPKDFTTFVTPSFYSSEAVARDADRVREYLNISEMAVYGVSYGTIPATIYGSLFPAKTRSVVLEGVIADASSELWESQAIRTLLQDMLDGLPSNIKTIVDSVAQRPGVQATWFSKMAWEFLLRNDGLATLKEKLLSLSQAGNLDRLVNHVQNYYAEIDYEPHILFTMNDTPYYMISCQELGLAVEGVVNSDVLNKGKLTRFADPVSPAHCRKLKAKTGKTYLAANYPVKVPIYYFQGEHDIATPVAQALQHFKEVPQGSRTFMLMKQGGHAPNMTYLRYDDGVQLQMFTQAITAKPISFVLVDEFNEANPEHAWTIRNF